MKKKRAVSASPKWADSVMNAPREAKWVATLATMPARSGHVMVNMMLGALLDTTAIDSESCQSRAPLHESNLSSAPCIPYSRRVMSPDWTP